MLLWIQPTRGDASMPGPVDRQDPGHLRTLAAQPVEAPERVVDVQDLEAGELGRVRPAGQRRRAQDGAGRLDGDGVGGRSRGGRPVRRRLVRPPPAGATPATASSTPARQRREAARRIAPIVPEDQVERFRLSADPGRLRWATMLEVLDQARLLVVTGKGGTGKTTVAAGLAMAAAGRGRRVLVVEVEGRQGLAGLFGRQELDHREVRVAEGVNALAVDPDESLREYLARYGFAPLARLLTWAHLNRFITAAAPGLGDVLLVGKVWEAATREARPGSGSYDLVVLDAPPTGRVVPFLRAPETVAELAQSIVASSKTSLNDVLLLIQKRRSREGHRAAPASPAWQIQIRRNAGRCGRAGRSSAPPSTWHHRPCRPASSGPTRCCRH